VAELERAVEGLDADLDWLNGQVKTLRGKVTGGKRGGAASEVDPGTTNGPRAYPYGSPEWFEAQRLKLMGR